MKKKIEIFSTIGPTSLNQKTLNYFNNKIDLVRINLSHVSAKELPRYIKYLKKNTNVKICVDTEGAQIRTKVNNVVNLKKNQNFTFYKNKFPFLYPIEVFEKIKKNDLLSIGFDDLYAKVLRKNNKNFKIKVLNSGSLETNKGVVILNRSVKLNYLTENDLKSIEIAKKYRINCFALSFTNDHEDVIKFKKILPNTRKIFKIESKRALKNFKKIIKHGDEFLIDRGDLSKETSIFKIPENQRKIIKEARKNKKKIFVATNFLESMIQKPYPTRAEVNDIYSSLEMGANGLVLAAETAIGKYPEKCVDYLKKIITEFNKKKN
tara:strand:- start:145 stop:1107 length:963 start_codon:yes stop_codon:yes gene_type:complete